MENLKNLTNEQLEEIRDNYDIYPKRAKEAALELIRRRYPILRGFQSTLLEEDCKNDDE